MTDKKEENWTSQRNRGQLWVQSLSLRPHSVLNAEMMEALYSFCTVCVSGIDLSGFPVGVLVHLLKLSSSNIHPPPPSTHLHSSASPPHPPHTSPVIPQVFLSDKPRLGQTQDSKNGSVLLLV